MALNQPLVPVLPVARELLSKTRWTASKLGNQPHDHPLRLLHPTILATDDDSRLNWIHGGTLKTIEGSSKHAQRNPFKNKKDSPVFTETPLTAEPESSIDVEPQDPTSRKRVKSLFGRSSRHSSKGRKNEKVSLIYPLYLVLLTLSVGCSRNLNQKMPLANLVAVVIDNIIYVLISLLTFTCIRINPIYLISSGANER